MFGAGVRVGGGADGEAVGWFVPIELGLPLMDWEGVGATVGGEGAGFTLVEGEAEELTGEAEELMGKEEVDETEGDGRDPELVVGCVSGTVFVGIPGTLTGVEVGETEGKE